jgi:predicted RNase H-like nuclease (RuvC/YqgF family)
MEIAVILLSMGFVLAVAIAHSYKKERDASNLALDSSGKMNDSLHRSLSNKHNELEESEVKVDGLVRDIVQLRTDLKNNYALIESMKQLAINDRTALKSALDEADLSNKEARNLASKVEKLQEALNEEQNMIIELEDKILKLKAKAKKAKAKKPVKKKK